MLRDKFFLKLSDIITKRTKIVFLIGLILTVIMGFGASRVKMKLAFHEMLPKDLPEIESFNRIQGDFGFAASENLIIESDIADQDRIIACVEELVPQIMQLQMTVKNSESNSIDTIKMVDRVEYKIDREFYRKNSFLIQKEKDLLNTVELFSSLQIDGFLKNLNDNFEKEYIGDERKQASLDGKQMLLLGLNSICNYIKGITDYLKDNDSTSLKEGVDELINGPEYFFSPDGKLLLMKVVIAEELQDSYQIPYGNKIKVLLKEMESKYPDLWFGATGDGILSTDTLESIRKDFGLPNIISILLIVFLVIGAFGSWKDPFWAMITLFIAIIWTVGFIGFSIRYLNLISIAFAILLVGLGIDFAIHLISGFKAAENEGLSPQMSVKSMYENRGLGIVTGGLTTACAFLALSFTGFSSLTEIAVTSGMGILFCMIASLTIFPAIMLYNNKGYSVIGEFLRKVKLGFIPKIWNGFWGLFPKLIPEKVKAGIGRFFQFYYLEKLGYLLQNKIVAVVVLLIGISITAYSVSQIKTIGFEYNFMKLEAEGVMSEVSQKKILKSFEMSPDFTFLISENLEQCRKYVEELKDLNMKSGLIARIDAISEFLPDSEIQRNNISTLKKFKTLIESTSVEKFSLNRELIIEELQRLHNNIVEIGELSIISDGEDNSIIKKCDEITGLDDSLSIVLKLKKLITQKNISDQKIEEVQNLSAKRMKELLLNKSVDTIVTINNLPQSIKDRYLSKNGDDLLLTVYSKGQIYDERILNKFTSELKKVSQTATGSPILQLKFLRLIIDKGAGAVIFAVIAIVILLLIDFKSITETLISIIPLIIGVSWLFGFISIIGMKLNFNSLMIFPLILGIGIDDAVHILHRYRKEGSGSIPDVLKCTGRSVFLTSLTTSIAFGAMAFSVRRGIASGGLILAVGVMFCFITSIIILPAIITLYESIKK